MACARPVLDTEVARRPPACERTRPRKTQYTRCLSSTPSVAGERTKHNTYVGLRLPACAPTERNASQPGSAHNKTIRAHRLRCRMSLLRTHTTEYIRCVATSHNVQCAHSRISANVALPFQSLRTPATRNKWLRRHWRTRTTQPLRSHVPQPASAHSATC